MDERAGHNNELNLDEDRAYEKKNRRFHLVGRAGMFVFTLAALLGLLGHGPLSDATAGEKSSALWLEYSRFEHDGTTAELMVHVGPNQAKDGNVRLWVNADYLDSFELTSISPQPNRMSAADSGLFLDFTVAEPGRPAEFSLKLKPSGFGYRQGELGLPAGPHLKFWQWVYP